MKSSSRAPYPLPFLLAAALWAVPVQAPAGPAAPAPAAAVLMVSGPVRLIRAGLEQPLREGQMLQAQDRLRAGPDGRAYFRLSDGSFIILRPGSTLDIQEDQFDPAHPEQARVRLSLQQGVARTITGPGLQQHKDRFRLNTPIAAIGVRGTDFTTYAADDLVRVSVHQGGVILAPYTADCLPNALGACQGEGAAELMASASQMLELRQGQAQARRLPATQGAPDSLAPPAETESRRAPAGSAAAAAAIQEGLLLERIDTIGSTPRPLPAPITPQPDIQLSWGRWAPWVGLPAGIDPERLPEGHKLMAITAVYALARAPGFELPRQGGYNFALQQGEAWLSGPSGSPQALAIGAASLNVDFAKQSFSTRMELSNAQDHWTLRGAGDISRDGRLVSSYAAGSNAVIRGALGGQGGNEAVYLFQQTLDDQRRIDGAAHWAHR